MLTTPSRTFNAGKDKHRLTLRAVQPEKPTGLAGVGWRWPGYDLNLTMDGFTHKRVGSLMVRESGNYAWSLGSIPGYEWTFNSLHKETCAKYSCGPHSYKTADFALDHVKDFIQCFMLDDMESWHP